MKCPKCGKEHAPPPGSAGSDMRCSCGAVFTITSAPSGGPTPPPLPASASTSSPAGPEPAAELDWLAKQAIGWGWAAVGLAVIAALVWTSVRNDVDRQTLAAILSSREGPMYGSVFEQAKQARFFSVLALFPAIFAGGVWLYGSLHPIPRFAAVRLAANCGLGAALVSVLLTRPDLLGF